MDSVQLSIPPLTSDSILTLKAGIRPFRKKGIRLETEYWKDKLIIHDYGHGGSGISLSWGSARMSLNLLHEALTNGFHNANNAIAILGCGIIGLTTAHLLADQGWKITIYANQFPPHTTSDIAPGLWNKVAVGGHKNPFHIHLLERILRESFKDFKHLSESTTPAFKGVSPLKIYTFKKDPPIQYLPEGLFPKGIPFTGIFNTSMQKQGLCFQSFLVDTTLYIPDLVEKARAKGIQFHSITFNSKSDLENLSEKILMNCTGYGARILFNDAELIPVCGQLIEVKARDDFHYMLAGPLQGQIDNYIIPIHNKIIVGGSYEFNVESTIANLSLCEHILTNIRHFYHR